MPRGVAKSHEHRIAELDVKIEKARQTLQELKAKRKELEAQKQVELLSKVEDAAAKKGVSVEALLKSILD